MTDAAAARSRRLKWTLSAAVLLVLVLLVFLVRFQIALLVRFQLAAGVGGSQKGAGLGTPLLKDDMQALAEYSPQQVAGYLGSSRSQWRWIACQVLETQSSRQDGANWEGIAPLLVHVALNDPEPALHRLAGETFQQLLSISAEDSRKIVAILKDQSGNPLRMPLISTVSQRCPQVADELRDLLMEVATANESSDRGEAVLKLAELFPDDERLPSLLKEVARGQLGTAVSVAGAVRKVAATRPELVAELLESGKPEQRVALLAMSGPSSLPMTASPRLADLRTESSRPVATNPELIDRATALAVELLRSGDADSRFAAINFFRWRPDGGHSLVQHLADGERDSRLDILRCLRGIAWAAYNANDGKFQFTKEEGDYLVGLLNDGDGEIRTDVAQVLNPGIPPGSRPQGPSFQEPAHSIRQTPRHSAECSTYQAITRTGWP